MMQFIHDIPVIPTTGFTVEPDHRVMDFQKVRDFTQKPLGDCAICAVLATKRACTVTDFEDADASEAAKTEVFHADDIALTGDYMGRASIRSAMEAVIPVVSLYSNTECVDMGKVPYITLEPGYTTLDLKKVAAQDQKLEDTDRKNQAALDNAKNKNDLAKAMGGEIPQPTTHMTDIVKRSGTKEFSVVDKDGHIVTKYKEDYRSKVWDKAFIDRSHSDSPDTMMYDMIRAKTPDGLYFDLAEDSEGKDCDGQGLPYLRINQRGLDKIDEDQLDLDRDSMLMPTEFKFTGEISAVNFSQWNQLPNGDQKIAMKLAKDLDRFDLPQIAYKLYVSKLTNRNDADDRKDALRYAIHEIALLFSSVTMMPVDEDDLLAFISNVTLQRAIPKDLTMGIGGSELPLVQISRAAQIAFKQGGEMFADLWLANKAGGIGLDWRAKRDAIAGEKKQSLIDFMSMKRAYHSETADNFSAAVFAVDPADFEVE